MTRVVLVTGCNGGIGRAICEKFDQKQWIVIGTDNIQIDNRFLDIFIKADLMKDDEIKILVGNLNKLDCIVNNAAYQICKPIEETTIEEFRAVLDCNLVAPFYLSKLCLPKLNNPSSIINIGSVHATATSDHIAAYAVSKAGLVGLTKNMAIELDKYNIRVNCISPGAIDTPMLRSHLDDHDITKMGKIVGQPQDVAELCYFLADHNKSKFITGANYIIDGGVTIKLSSENK